MLLKGHHSHTPSTTPSIGSRLVLRGVYYMDLAPILPVPLRLLVHTSTTWSLLTGPQSHTSSTTLFTGSRLVLRAVYCKGILPILLVLLRLLIQD
jgi:hypothetical protein